MLLTPSSDAVVVEHIAEVSEPHHVACVADSADWHPVVVAHFGHATPLGAHLMIESLFLEVKVVIYFLLHYFFSIFLINRPKRFYHTVPT